MSAMRPMIGSLIASQMRGSVCPDGGEVPLEGRDRLSTEGFAPETPEIRESGDALAFTLSGVRFRIEKKNFRITAESERGVLFRDRGGLAYNKRIKIHF